MFRDRTNRPHPLTKGEPILNADIVRNVAALIEQHGSNVWFEKSAAELWALTKPKNWSGAEAAAKSQDTLDVWIDSGSSSRAVLMRRSELQRRREPFGVVSTKQLQREAGLFEVVQTSRSSCLLAGGTQGR